MKTFSGGGKSSYVARKAGTSFARPKTFDRIADPSDPTFVPPSFLKKVAEWCMQWLKRCFHGLFRRPALTSPKTVIRFVPGGRVLDNFVAFLIPKNQREALKASLYEEAAALTAEGYGRWTIAIRIYMEVMPAIGAKLKWVWKWLGIATLLQFVRKLS